jgi:hypothetical protein
MPNTEQIELCRKRLIETARAKARITYGELAAHLGLKTARNIRIYLNPIYDREMQAGRPDLTLVAVNSKTGYGWFNSEGGPAQSVPFDGKDLAQVARYEAGLNAVYEQWA